MVSVIQKSRSCVLLLLSLTPSIFPPLSTSILPALTISVWPALSSSVMTTERAMTPLVGSTNISTISNAPTIRKSSTSTVSPMSSSKASFATMYPSKSMSATSKTSVVLFYQTSHRDHLVSSPPAATKPPQFGLKASLSTDPVRFHPVSHLPLKQLAPDISRLQPHPCKRLKLSLKTIGPPQYPVSSEKRPLHAAKLFPPSNKTLLPKSLPSSCRPQTASRKLPSPVSTSSFSTALLSLASTTSPPPLAKTSPIPLLETLTSPPEAAASRQSGPLPPPSLPHTTGPLFEHQPFIVSWNIPDLVCNRYNISLDTSPFKGVATPAKVMGQIFECLVFVNE